MHRQADVALFPGFKERALTPGACAKVRERGAHNMQPKDYKDRTYLSANEAAKYLGISVEAVHDLTKKRLIKARVAPSGQMRFDSKELRAYEASHQISRRKADIQIDAINIVEVNGTVQKLFVKNSMKMNDLANDSVHLMVTSPPYFDTKMYSREPVEGDLGNVHDMNDWFGQITQVWEEVYRVLQPGRKAFINIMNLPIRIENGTFRTLNLVGRTIDVCERIGFVFRRDIVWHKTNAVRAHFGTYPYPGGILINNMHEFILEFAKPERKGFNKYAHLTSQQKEESKLDKQFWLSIKNSDVWVMKPQGSGDRRSHVAPFPYELPYRIIRAFSYVGETILDPFVGSGTTLLAAAELRRNGIGYEINPDIALGAVKSLSNFQPTLPSAI
jgi:DNA modification methylase